MSRAAVILLASLLPVIRAPAQDAVQPLSSFRVHVVMVEPLNLEWGSRIADFVTQAVWTQATFTNTNGTACPSTNGDACCGADIPDTNSVTVYVSFSGSTPEDNKAWEFWPERRCGIVRAARLKPEAVDTVAASELWLTRLQKQTAFVAARLLGVAACELPLCLMNADASLEDVDYKARGLCPPCREKLSQLFGLPD